MYKIKTFSADTIPKKYKRDIIDGHHCFRDGKRMITQKWLQFQLNRAPIITVALDDDLRVAGFLMAYRHNGPDTGSWTLNTICTKRGSRTGPLLMESFINKARKSRAKQITLYATTQASKRAYKKYGFQIDDSICDGDDGASMYLAF